ncbi:MAG TPA: histidine kinase [Streptosporangiaceae bacterium]|jgi:signal transduction histidine kinase
MASTAGQRPAPRWRFVRAPWSRLAWRDTAFVVAGMPVQFLAFAILAAPWSLSAFGSDWTPVTLNQITLALLIPVILICALLPVLTAMQRDRFRALLGEEIPRPAAVPRPDGWRGLTALARSETSWRQLGYHLVAGPAIAFGGLLTLTLWAAGLVLFASPAYLKAVPVSYSLGLHDGGHKWVPVIFTLAGLSLLLLAPRVAAAVTRVDRSASSALLGLGRARQLELRVVDLASSRAEVVDAADAERRRIERDLHDGAQQRLVSLAMNLGLARATLTDLPEDARQVIVAAHEEAKEALGELRSLVRGLHPAVLEDRGLDAALSGVAARTPLAVRLQVDVPVRPSPTVEAIAYFVVSEALANVAKHAQASHASVTVWRAGDLLRVEVTDDGVGGADPSLGTGLAGLSGRVRSVDGQLEVTSPAGGPTRIYAELPCES